MRYSDYKKLLDRLKADNRRGATYIENLLYDIFITASSDLLPRQYRRLVENAQNWPTVMANIVNLIETTAAFLRQPDCDIGNQLSKLKKNVALSRRELCRKAANTIKKYNVIVTVSYSGLVYDSLRLAARDGWPGTVLLGEARPMLEGRDLAKALSRIPLKVVFGADCQVFSMLDMADAAFVGADAVCRRFFINKTGTSALVSCLGKNKKVYVLADISKYRDFNKDICIPDYPPEEIWKRCPRNILIENRYFEKIYYKGNTVLINEFRRLNPTAVKNFLKKDAIAINI